MSDLFAAPAPRVFAIAPHRPFLDDLARTLADALGDPDDPFALADATILVPNRRAARELGAAFVRAAGEDPPATLLPAIRALGDVEEDEPPFEPGEITLAAPPAISAARRRFELAALLHARAKAQDPGADPAASLPLADELGRLLDEAATAVAAGAADFGAVKEMYELLPGHLQQSAVFLDIVLTHWPKRLAELGRIDAAHRRELILHALAERWVEAPPAEPVIAAGSTGSLPATQAVLAAVASLPQGAVVLPGLDVGLDARAWDEIDEGHPQANLKRTLEALDVPRDRVAAWPGPVEPGAARARRRLVNEALRPAAATDDWLARIAELNSEFGDEFGAESGDVAAKGLEGLALLEAPTPDAEARAVALATREALEDPDCDVMVVTPDLSLADRIVTALARFGVAADMSAGRPLIETVPGAFLAHVLELARDPGSPVAIAALAKHELAALGRTHRGARIRFAEVERLALRGVRAGPDLGPVLARLVAKEASEEARALVADLDAAIAPLAALDDGGAHAVAALADAHVEVAETIATDEGMAGAARIWREPAGESAAALVRELLEESAAFPPVTLDGYARLYERLARLRAVRARGEESPRVRVLGPLEARLQSAGLVIAAGLNEGAWPAHPAEDPFLSRTMRDAAGLPPPERRLSLAAHDFAQLACAPRVLLTRAKRDDSGPTLASRWLWRLRTLAEGAAAAPPQAQAYAAIAAALDRVAPADARPVARAEARPPVKARPRRLSASGVGEWVRDPYGLYARRVLSLKPLDPLDRPPGPLERGDAIHAALYDVVNACRDALPEDFAARIAARAMAALEAKGFGPAELVAEAERMARAADWFAAWERERRAKGWRPAALEVRGEATFKTKGGDFTIAAIADRVDVNDEGGLAILDYKSGQPPTARQVGAGLAPQLGVEAAIQMLAGFGELARSGTTELIYLRVRGGRTPGSIVDLSAGKDGLDVPGFAEETLGMLKAGAAKYARKEQAYVSRARVERTTDVRDFDRLARVKEWATPGDTE